MSTPQVKVITTQKELAEHMCEGKNTGTGMPADELVMMAKAYIRKRAAYFGPMLNRLTFREHEHIPTLATSKGGICIYNKHLLEMHDISQVAWMICHEALHLFLRHFDRGIGQEPGKRNRNQDRAINTICDDLGFKRPNFKVCWPADINQPNGLTSEEYYAFDKDDEGDGQGGGGIGQGACGSCAGNPSEHEPDAGDDDQRSSTDIARGAKQMAEQAEAEAKEAGKVPAGIAKVVKGLIAPPRVRWSDQLAAAVRQAYQYRAGMSVFRFDGPARKQAAVGWGEGKPILPRLRSPIPSVAVAIDTSGSMWGGPEIPQALGEADAILKYLNCPIEFLACDAEVHEQGRVMDIEKLKTMLKGGGGTAFEPVFEALEKKKTDVLVYFTDGYGSYPPVPPKNMSVIWVLVGQSVHQPPWGTVIRVEP